MSTESAKYPVFSVVIPNYNGATYLEETLHSVANQTYASFEVIVVDNASTDTSRQIARRFVDEDSRFSLIERKSNSGGPAVPRNDGILQSNGAYVVFLDADDTFYKHKLQKLHQCIIKDRFQVDLYYHHFHINHDSFGKDLSLYIAEDPFLDILLDNKIALSTVAVKRETLDQLGMFDTSAGVNTAEDWDLWLRITGAGKKIQYIDESLGNYRQFSDSLSSRKIHMHRANIKNVFEKNYSFRVKDHYKNPVYFRELWLLRYELINQKIIYKNQLFRRGISIFKIFIKALSTLRWSDVGRILLKRGKPLFRFYSNKLSGN